MHALADENRVAELVGSLESALGERLGPERGRSAALIGLRRRGDTLARRLGPRLGIDQVGALDVTLYRDDLAAAGARATVRATHVPFAVDGLDVVLLDDVLMSGRSVRAALQSLSDLGRPRRVHLAVLVDRGGRELPIQPDIAGLVPAAAEVPPESRVEVQLKPEDEADAIVVRGQEDTERA
jgi:pyrimidine operon attenuation protein/uracil phosphoribosyltransferase